MGLRANPLLSLQGILCEMGSHQVWMDQQISEERTAAGFYLCIASKATNPDGGWEPCTRLFIWKQNSYSSFAAAGIWLPGLPQDTH